MYDIWYIYLGIIYSISEITAGIAILFCRTEGA
jgi:hypothetical protein